MRARTSWRPIAVVIILVATIIAFAAFFRSHPELRHQLGQTPPAMLIPLLLLYLVFTGSLAMVNSAALRLCRQRIAAGESLLLTMYSAVINFFGPLQSGPAFRALYLKQRHGVKLLDYTAASFVYYFFYALFSVLLLFSSLLKWWLLIPALASLLAIQYHKRHPAGFLRGLGGLKTSGWYYMATATAIQVSLLVIIFYIELHSVAPGVQLSQVLVYTGAANLALFVSLTPGAIGFRESFLLFTQRLHHIDSSTIIAANLIDRSVYIIMLLIIAAAIFGTHANRRLRLTIPANKI